MTYEITIQNGLLPEAPLFYGGDPEYGIYDDMTDLVVGQAGIFKFTVPPSNPSINQIKERETIVTIYRDNEEWWRGEVREVSQNFDLSRSVVCYEDISWLYDADIVPQSATRTYAQWFQHALGKYNNDCAILGSGRASRQFDIGFIYNDTGLTKKCDVEYGTSVMDFLRENICTAYGYLRVRRVKEAGVQKRYIDIVSLAHYGSVINQSIEFGENMLDYVKECETGHMLTGIHPLGAEIEDEEIIPDVAKRIDIKSVNSNVDYLIDSQSMQKYGWIMQTVIWDEITDPLELKTIAQEYLSDNCKPKYTWSLDAVDLSLFDISLDSISLGCQVPIFAEPFDVDTSVPVTELSISITNASKNTVTLSEEVSNTSITQQMSAASESLKGLPEESEILKSAKVNALRMLNGSVGGHVIFKFDETNRYVEELIICNASTEEASTKKWVYNLNGWGYMKRNTISDDWTDMGIAATMDGQLVAEFITAGVLTGQTLNGATVHAGYIGNGDNIDNTTIEITSTTGTKMCFGSNSTWPNSCNIVTNGNAADNHDGFGTVRKGNTSEGCFLHWKSVRKWEESQGIYGWEVEFNAPSDRRLKHNIKDFPIEKVRKLILNLKFKSFDFIEDKLGIDRYGLIAQEVEEALEESEIESRDIVKDRGDGFLKIEYTSLLKFLFPAVRDLYSQVDELKEEINKLKGEK